jgi:hypothetical protein
MHRSFRLPGLLTGFLALSSCIDADRSPTGTERIRGARTVSLVAVAPATRATPLPEDVTWTFEAGPNGAMSRNDEVGLTIVVPGGALSAPQTITVTALAGSAVAYRFEPHLVFDRRVRLTQDLSVLNALLTLGLAGAHFEGDALQIVNGLATVTEIAPATVSILRRTVTFDVSHFSGWIVASGNGDPPPDSSGSEQ